MSLDETSRLELIIELASLMKGGNREELTWSVFYKAISRNVLCEVQHSSPNVIFHKDGKPVSGPDVPSVWKHQSVDSLIEVAIKELAEEKEWSATAPDLKNLLKDSPKRSDPIFKIPVNMSLRLPVTCVIGEIFQADGCYLFVMEDWRADGEVIFVRDIDNPYILRQATIFRDQYEQPDMGDGPKLIEYEVLAVNLNTNWFTVGMKVGEDWSYSLPTFKSKFDVSRLLPDAEEWVQAGMV